MAKEHLVNRNRGKYLNEMYRASGGRKWSDPIEKSKERHTNKVYNRVSVGLRHSEAKSKALETAKRRMERKYDSEY